MREGEMIRKVMRRKDKQRRETWTGVEGQQGYREERGRDKKIC